MSSLIRILLIEDDEDDYILTRKFLSEIRGKQYELVWAPSYEEGWDQFEQNGFSAVLVDYSLGERNGLDFIRQATALDRTVPIILLTGQGSYDIDLQAMQAGAVDYLNKGDINSPLLERALRYAVERKQAELKLRQDAARFELLANLSNDFVEAGLDYRKLLNTITRQIAEMLGDASMIHILQEDQQTLNLVSAHHPDAQAQKMMRELLFERPQRIGEGLVREVVLTRKASYFQDNPTETLISHSTAESATWIRQYPIDSLYIAPLCSRSQSIGTITILRNHPGGPIRADEQAFYIDLANRAALAIDNATLYKEVQQLAVTDPLTGLLNRRGFFQLGEREMGRYQRYRHPLSMIMLDVDSFKLVNDSYGHALGDEALKALGQCCSDHVRQTDITSRLGGDEFVILLPETDVETALTVAERIHTSFRGKQFSTRNGLIQLSASFGVTTVQKEMDDLEDLIHRADQALYNAKQKGRNRVEVG